MQLDTESLQVDSHFMLKVGREILDIIPFNLSNDVIWTAITNHSS